MVTVPEDAEVWTATERTGGLVDSVFDRNSWSEASSDRFGVVRTAVVDGDLHDVHRTRDGNAPCSERDRLYCFEL